MTAEHRVNFLVRSLSLALTALTFVFVFGAPAYGCKAALLFPDKSELSSKISPLLREALAVKCDVIDASLSETAFDSENFPEPYNLSLEDARNFSTAIGVDVFMLVKSGVQSRISFEQGEVFEAYALSYLVDGRSGKLIQWYPVSNSSRTETESVSNLIKDIQLISKDMMQNMDGRARSEKSSNFSDEEFEMIDGDSPSQTIRPPAPYKRISPPYTGLAKMYGIEAVVEAVAYIDRTGKTKRVVISRWAGFGLDESVAGALLEMNWRPAQKNGSAIPSRILVRYNFKKLPKD